LKALIDYNPLTGERCYMTTEGGKLHITNEQDPQIVQAILDSATDLRNRPDYSKNGIKNDLWHYGRVPISLLYEAEVKHGIKCLGGEVDWPGLFAFLNKTVPRFKTTDKTHA
jgi:hypothetical protein